MPLFSIGWDRFLIHMNELIQNMEKKRLSLRMSEKRLNKLRAYAADRDKTITSLVEDWIDSLLKRR
ncbi:hypothetical protein BC008_45535 [Mastigocoleus testarum BC008]|uniref:Uncharacterized protein n=1 Tax=Mastigocoleus testarum BC008 TaxID=371196 RepID=A0A0V8A116_9CYAN|nr:hypothetical protein BC008_21580 [Mastigocoleus testarum BC008]KST70453.1 hypothetical protein BC008_45535 [Mastigocoleus testarum BC008]